MAMKLPLLPETTGGGGGATDLTYDAPTGTMQSSTGADAVIPVATTTDPGLMSAADKTKIDATTGTNTGDQTSIVGITGTKAQFDTAVTDGNFLYVGDVTQYTDELAQDAIGAMVDGSLVYVDATPLLQRAALTGAITAAAGSNATALGSFTKAQLDAAVSDGNVLYVGDITGNATHTGDATGATALTLATVNSNVGSFGSATQVATFTVNAKGLTTAAAAVSIQIAESQVTNLVSDLALKAPLASPTFTGTVTLPASQVVNGVTLSTAAGTGNFLRGDGTYAAPPGGGGGSPGGATGEVQFNNAGAFDGAADVEIEGGQLRLPAIATPTAPAAGGLKLFGRSVGGRLLPAVLGPSGLDTSLQPHFGRNKVGLWSPLGNATTITSLGMTAPTAVGTATAANVATTNLHTYMRRIEYLVTTASTTAIAGWRVTSSQFTIGGPSAALGGFHFVCRWGPATGQTTGTKRCFVGMRPAATPTDVEPSTIANIVGMGFDTADTNIQIMHRGAGAITKIDLGASFPKPTADRTNVYELALFSPPGTTQSVDYEVTNLATGAVVTGSITTNLPTSTTLLGPHGWMSVGGTSSVIGIALMGLYIETDF